MARQQIVRCFFDTHMGLAHDGLRQVAANHSIKLDTLEPGEFVVFINSSRDRLKVFAASNTFAYWRSRNGSKLDLNAIREIPRVFGGTAIGEYDKALEIALTKRLERKKSKSRFSVLDAARYAKEVNASA